MNKTIDLQNMTIEEESRYDEQGRRSYDLEDSIKLCEHGKPINTLFDNNQIDWITSTIRQNINGCNSPHVQLEMYRILGELWELRHPCYTCYTTY